MPKFESSIYLDSIKGLSANVGDPDLIYLGKDNRVGIGTSEPETKLHVEGGIKATGLDLTNPLPSPGQAATVLGFNPNFDEWQIQTIDDASHSVANGYIQTGSAFVEQSAHSALSSYSARFLTSPTKDDDNAVWSREVRLEEPLYANVFLSGSYNYRFTEYTSGHPGIAITLSHRQKGDNTLLGDGVTWSTEYSNTFISPTFGPGNNKKATGEWQTAIWRATTPGDREITALKIEIISTEETGYTTSSSAVELSQGAGSASVLGRPSGTFYVNEYDWYLDGITFDFWHPDFRIDQDGRILGAFIKFGEIEEAHIKDAAITNAKIENQIYSPSSTIQATGDDENVFTPGLVANSTQAHGWSISKDGLIKAKEIKIYGDEGQVLISGGSTNPFSEWVGKALHHLDQDAYDYLYALSFDETFNATNLRSNTSYLLTSGLHSDTIVSNNHSVHFANVVDGSAGHLGSHAANGVIKFNGVSINAPAGSIVTGENLGILKEQSGHVLFLANTQKWDTRKGMLQEYHANTYLGDYGLYALGRKTFGGWMYHPHGNTTWHTISETIPTDSSLHQHDFLVLGTFETDQQNNPLNPSADTDGHITSVQLGLPQHPDSIQSESGENKGSPFGMSSGGVVFADIHINQWGHKSGNTGQVQLTNPRNQPNTHFAVIHPTADNSDAYPRRYVTNFSNGVVTSLESFSGTRFLVFVGGDKTRFDLPEGTSPDFVAAFPRITGGSSASSIKWYYDTDEGNHASFTPDKNKDFIIARFDSDGSGQITEVERYSNREVETEDGIVLSDLIIDPPRGMDFGGVVFASSNVNYEFNDTNNTYTSNAGFIAFANDNNSPKQNEFFVVHPRGNYIWLIDGVNRGVVTNLSVENGVQTKGGDTGNTEGTRHIAFVGSDPTRFTMAAGYSDVSTDFVAITKYDLNGRAAPSGRWFYDNGEGIRPYRPGSPDAMTFAPIANDFIIATAASYNAESDVGIDQLKEYFLMIQ